MMDDPRHKSMRPGTILSRLFVVLVLALLGVPQDHANGSTAPAGPAAESHVSQSHGILAVQRHLLRAQQPGDDTPDLAGQLAAVSGSPVFRVARTAAVERPHPVPAVLRILPQVRGPPAV